MKRRRRTAPAAGAGTPAPPDVPSLGKRPARRFQALENRPASRAPAVCFISLGCDKNTVDTERLMARLIEGGFHIAERPQDSDLALVNTCGFIAEARAESRHALEALAAGRRRGRPRRIVALGCLVERGRAAGMPPEDLPADAAIGFADYGRIAEICRVLLAGGASVPASAPGALSAPEAAFDCGPRLLTGPRHVAALKIAEGCSNRCRYCAIPLIRGPLVSRPIEELVAETRQLVEAGAREISIIGQDTASYGLDRYGERCLSRLLRALAEAAGPARFRLMYAHPRHVTDELLDLLSGDPRFLPYLDMPLQHVNDRVLREMGRGLSGAETRRIVERIRTVWPAAALRTTYLVGFPGETEAEFEELRRWVEEGAFLHAGVFAYSSEPGTPAGERADDVPAAEKERRRAALMAAQRIVSRRRLAEWRGREIEVVVDEVAGSDPCLPYGAAAIGRAAWQAPEVDGVVYVRARGRPPDPGRPLATRVVETLDYDLVAHAMEGRKGLADGGRGKTPAPKTRGGSAPPRSPEIGIVQTDGNRRR